MNNAGMMLLSPFSSRLVDEWRTMIETNLVGALEATETFLDQLLDGGGDIVNVSSVAGRKATGPGAVYSATTWGLNGWSEGLRQELGPRDVRVIVIEPGAVATELTSHITPPEEREAAEQRYTDFGALRPEDVAEVIAFAVVQPRNVSLSEILIRPTRQAF